MTAGVPPPGIAPRTGTLASPGSRGIERSSTACSNRPERLRMVDIAVSILMPVYNVAPYLRPALDSVFRQTWQDFELLIVDDGSTDGTRAMLAEIRDPRVQVIYQEHGGLA